MKRLRSIMSYLKEINILEMQKNDGGCAEAERRFLWWEADKYSTYDNRNPAVVALSILLYECGNQAHVNEIFTYGKKQS